MENTHQSAGQDHSLGEQEGKNEDKNNDSDNSDNSHPDADHKETRQMSNLSGEWMTMPSLGTLHATQHVAEEVVMIPQQEKIKGNTAIDDSARNECIEGMRLFLSDVAHQEKSKTTIADNSINKEDAVQFLELHKACQLSGYMENEREISPLKQEIMMQILEDYGEQLLGKQPVDAMHLEYLRRIVLEILTNSNTRAPS